MNKKSILVLLCVFALVAASTFGTLAYLTDTDEATNTFTVGKVAITLDEADVKTDGSLDTEERVTENKYHLLPGHTYIKDPTIHVDVDSKDCYLFVTVENGLADIEAPETIAEQMLKLGWKAITKFPGLYVYVGDTGLDKAAVSAGTDIVVFERFTIAGDNVTGATLDAHKDAEIVVTGYAVQMNGFEDTTPEDIWVETFGKAA